ncbi:MAG: MaoC family dehydratase [Rhodospirillaceae bacterium]|nr:MaoC family dehydratase [Rhodospirillaceae bacterium]
MTETAAASALVIDAADLPNHIGRRLGPSRWVTIDQPMIDGFAAVSGDRHWVHTDPERARRDLPWGNTLAHGYLTLSLITDLMGDVLALRFKRAMNYGLNRVRFTNAVPAGSRVRLFATLKSAEPTDDGGMRLISQCEIAIEGKERPALVAETISIFYP